MKIKSIKLKDFKRFRDLTVENLPETARLVVLVGPNGSGKSSVFEAFNSHARFISTSSIHDSLDYFYKSDGTGNYGGLNLASFFENHAVKLEFHSQQALETRGAWKKVFYIRTAYRNDPDFVLQQLKKVSPVVDEERFRSLIHNDAAIELNYRRLISDAIEDLFYRTDENKTIREFRKEVIGEIREAVEQIFDDPTLTLNSLGNPLIEGTFRFDKGESKKFSYKNLSGGEKAAFDLILDMIIKRREFDDTIFCIDEPESHMSTSLQGRLLDVLYKLLKKNSQLWIATHSIGMMRKARELWAKNNGEVVFLDFDKNFDDAEFLEPVSPDRTFWRKIYNVALDDLSKLVAPERIVLCEGAPQLAEKGFDAQCYNKIFKSEMPETLFLSVGGVNDVQKNNLLTLINNIVSGAEVIRLVDRDDATPQGVAQQQREGIRVLTQRSIENYLLSNEVIKILCQNNNIADKADELINGRDNYLQRQGLQADEFKSAAGHIYTAVRNLPRTVRIGRNYEQFMRDILAPLITLETETYKQLREDIFNK